MNDEQSPAPRAGSQVGNYELQGLLGSGRLGKVYSAGNVVTRELVAVKLMSAELCADRAYREQFHRANGLAARLPEPHAVPIRDWGEIGGVLYIETELVDGHDLRHVLATAGPLAAEPAVAAIEQVAGVLDAAHEMGLVHGDVKPENLLLTRTGFWQLADFGLLPDGSGAVSAAPAYSPPERASGFPVSPSGDVYALACLLHECLTGAPFTPGSARNMPGFDAVIARGTATDPEDRYAGAGEFARAARQVLAQPAGGAWPAAGAAAGAVGAGAAAVAPPPSEQAWSEVPQQPVAAWPPPPPPQYAPPAYPSDPPPARRSAVFPVLISILVVVLLALAGLVGWLLFTGTNDETGQTTTTAAQTAPPAGVTTTAPAPTSAAPALPAGAVPCPAVYGATGSYTRSAAGNTTTSCPFAEEVRRAYATAGNPRQVTATSPVTGQSYTMACNAAGKLVTCSGGNSAIVYLY